MNRFIGGLVIAGMLGLFPAGFANAQEGVTTDAVVEACHQGDDAAACEAAVLAYIAALDAAGLAPIDRDDLLADLVVRLAANTSTMPAAVQLRVAAAIRTASTAVADPERRTQMAAAADAVERGEDPASSGTAASPA